MSLSNPFLSLLQFPSINSDLLDQGLSQVDEKIKSIFLQNSCQSSDIYELIKQDLGKKDESLVHLYIKSFISAMPQINNVGDPFEKHYGPFAGDTKAFMLEVLDFFAAKTNFKKSDKTLDFRKGIIFLVMFIKIVSSFLRKIYICIIFIVFLLFLTACM